MKNIIILLAFSAMLFAACKKSKTEEPQPQPDPVIVNPAMEYTELTNLSLTPGYEVYFDADKDGRRDMTFKTENISFDGNTKSKIAFKVENSLPCRMAVDTNTEATPRLIHKETITLADMKGYAWLHVLSLTLMEQVFAGNTTKWQGLYTNAGKAYFPFQIVRLGKVYLGWIELSSDLDNRKIIFHRIALSKEPVDKIYAGL